MSKIDHEMARLGHEMVRYADDSVILCRNEEEAKKSLEEMKGMLEARGLTLHPDKTRIVDATQRSGFDFLGYHFERGMRWPRKKSMDEFKETIRHKTRRTSGESMKYVLFINFYLNDKDIRFLNNLETPVQDGDHIFVVPAIAGG
ncbi:MAG: hypothetical protein E3K37_00385 [Candidatus Kuenenia sp.]|nr:hypothetical protein [Candidatus Kuenenia hertensis]